MRRRTNLRTGVAVLLCVCAFTACTVAPGGSTGTLVAQFTIGGKTFTITLDLMAPFRVSAGGPPVAQPAGVALPFADTPADTPSSGSLNLNANSVAARPLDFEKRQPAAQALTGSASVRVLVSQTTVNPCEQGIEVGSFDLTLTNGMVMVQNPSLDLPDAALALVAGGEFNICLSVTATVDVTLIFDEIGVEFGPTVPGTGPDNDNDSGTGTDWDDQLANDNVAEPGDQNENVAEPGEENENAAEPGDENANDNTADDAPGAFPAAIEYRQTMTVLVKAEDVDDYLTEHPHDCGTSVVSADGSKVAFKSWVEGWRVPGVTDNVHTYVINPDGTGLTDLNSAMPAEMQPDTVGLLLLNDNGTRLFASYQSSIYYVDLPSGTWTLAIAEEGSLGNMGGHKPYMINGAGTRMYFKEDQGWNTVTEKYDMGIYYADLGGAPVSLMDLEELPPPTATPMNMFDLVGNAPDGTVLFTWNEDYYAGDSTGLWKVGPGGGATRVDPTTHHYTYSLQSDLMPNKIVSADASVALYHWGTADSEFYLDLIDMNTGAATTLATDTGLNDLYNFALSGDGRYARYGMPRISSALHDIQTGDRRETNPYYTNFSTWGTELSDLTHDGRYQYQTDTEYTRIYQTDFRPGAGPYSAAPSVSAIAFSAADLPNDGSTTITATAAVSDPQGLGTVTDVNWLPLIDGHEDIGGDSPLTADWYWMYDDGTHGDAVAGDGVFTQDTIHTAAHSSVYEEITLPYEFGFRVLVTDEDGNHTIADTVLTITE